MSTTLEALVEDGIIEGIIGRLKSGKEAEVWMVEHQGEIVAAKLYKDRATRNFRNNIGYREGREVRNSRTARAIAKGTRFGLNASEDAWKSAEVDALYALHAAGVRVPAPVLFYEGILLMELVIDATGHPAPRLIEAPPVSPEEALALYVDLRTQVTRMLAVDLVHGDLSAYNVLSAWNGPTIIDFPQTVAAARNNSAERFFKRDMDGIRTFLAGFNPELHDLEWETDDLWLAYQRRELHPEYLPNPARKSSRLGAGGRRGRRRGGPRPDRGPEVSAAPGAPVPITHFDRSAFAPADPAEAPPPPTRTELDPEAELKALEATLLRQGGGARSKPAAPPASGRGGRGPRRSGGGPGKGPGGRSGGAGRGSGASGGGAGRGPGTGASGGGARFGARNAGPRSDARDANPGGGPRQGEGRGGGFRNGRDGAPGSDRNAVGQPLSGRRGPSSRGGPVVERRGSPPDPEGRAASGRGPGGGAPSGGSRDFRHRDRAGGRDREGRGGGPVVSFVPRRPPDGSS